MEYNYEAAFAAEQSVLGALMIDSEKLVEVRGILEESDFFDERNRQIYAAIIKLSEEDTEPDTTTIFNEIYGKGAFKNRDASLYLVEVYEITPTAKNVIYYANIVKKYSIYREVKSVLLDNMQKMNEGSIDLDSVVSTVVDQIERATERAKSSAFKNIKDVTKDVFDEIIAKMSGVGQNVAVPTGFSSLDFVLHGFSKGDLVILAARPSMGKTAFALNIALNISDQKELDGTKKTVALFSLEMGADQLVSRMLCSQGMIESDKLRTGNMDRESMEALEFAIAKLNDKNIYIDDSAFIKVNEVKAKCKALKNENGLDLVIIDYLQLLQGSRKTDNRQQEVSEISRSLKQMARELECPVIALSQLSRSVESRQDKRPMMSDLRESGSIEQDADIVSFLYRDDYYNREEDEEVPTDNKDVTTIEVIIAKHRNGSTGTAELAFLKKYNKFITK
ncbi:replicative DNA helicase [Gemelliphila palaticanis]|uniref:Replicative DNA helicase n=1 Tax=Gemelliphila palaticanis TaxID=81950 RepID=A0ABX2SXB5_9BACL|nr:replicative DNA helicase [Gemella palaticanis]MBF0714799.1 replicative DNA helicase [Gemella palaticanis]NYS46729.1 replicative DNA helicase [Gemella palaticanis]